MIIKRRILQCGIGSALLGGLALTPAGMLAFYLPAILLTEASTKILPSLRSFTSPGGPCTLPGGSVVLFWIIAEIIAIPWLVLGVTKLRRGQRRGKVVP
ncbi:MAG: hypothetical protein J0L84_20330 [Verrucomicrobia bacterium]|nr:hypothetical protein [Verrucomicrobiota bacterium]